MIVGLIIVVVSIFIAYKIYRSFYFIKYDNTLLLIGAPGTGKTNEGVSISKKVFRILKHSVKKKNRWLKLRRKPLLEMPELYSNMPIRIGRYTKKEYTSIIDNLESKGFDTSKMNISRDKFCKPLKLEHICLQERLPMKSVVFITEVGRIASQYNWQNLNVQQHVTEFFANYRHYTQGGYVFMDDQSISSVAKVIRVRLGSALDMLHFHKFWKFYWNRMRNISITEDIVMVEDSNKEDSMKWHLGMFPLFHRNYDTYFMSRKYDPVPYGEDDLFVGYKTNETIVIPETTQTKYAGQIITEGLFPKLTSDKDVYPRH